MILCSKLKNGLCKIVTKFYVTKSRLHCTPLSGPTFTVSFALAFAIIHEFLSSSALIFRVFSWFFYFGAESSFLNFSLKSKKRVEWILPIAMKCCPKVSKIMCALPKKDYKLISILILLSQLCFKNWFTFFNTLWLSPCLFWQQIRFQHSKLFQLQKYHPTSLFKKPLSNLSHWKVIWYHPMSKTKWEIPQWSLRLTK